jgi:ABC-type polysaccharide/polyol phosphate transport system ATPase subunit
LNELHIQVAIGFLFEIRKRNNIIAKTFLTQENLNEIKKKFPKILEISGLFPKIEQLKK